MISGASVLVIEDEEIASALIGLILAEHGHQVTNACDAETAWKILKSGQLFDAILLDRGLPGMDGITLLHRIKADAQLSKIPVIIETCLDDSSSLREGIEAGAYYYLTKPLQAPLLLAVMQTAIAQYREFAALQTAMQYTGQRLSYLTEASFSYRSMDDAHALARSLAELCPDPARAVLGLQELLVNAVEHGSLGISYAEKTALLIDNFLDQELERRAADPTWSARRVSVQFVRTPESIRFTIQDEGNGFAWQDYLEMSPERAFDPNGRGIAMARMVSFDDMHYLGCGNVVEITIRTA
ncbi:MAG: DNA-binding response OmpR family regulator [Janthinobacterium sp.]|jgi:DNA-binding response OmpR family regulator